MSRILEWTEPAINGLKEAWGLSCVLTEADDAGSVTRELGFDEEGNLVYRFPGEPNRARHGVFDLPKVDAPSGSDVSAEAFERIWSA